VSRYVQYDFALHFSQRELFAPKTIIPLESKYFLMYFQALCCKCAEGYTDSSNMVYSNHNPRMPHQFESILRIQMGLGKSIFPTNKNGDHLVQVKYKLVGIKGTTIAGQHEQENNAFTPLIC
jgi:hypothetical protein